MAGNHSLKKYKNYGFLYSKRQRTRCSSSGRLHQLHHHDGVDVCRILFSSDSSAQVGDEVLTAGGLLGKISGVSEHYAIVKISDNTEVKIQKSSVSMVVPKGTYDEA